MNIGPVHKQDVMKASVMLEHKKEWVHGCPHAYQWCDFMTD